MVVLINMEKSNTFGVQFKIIDGQLPILLSAPHTYPHRRPNLSGVYKGREEWLDVIIQSVCSKSAVHGIYVTNDIDYDPNFSPLENNEYKSEVASLIKNKKIKYFIDIHGLNDMHEYDFGLLYANRYLKSKNLAYTLANGLNSGGLRGSSMQVHNLVDGYGETLSHFVSSKLKVASVQVEIAKYIRDDAILRSEFIENLLSTIAKL